MIKVKLLSRLCGMVGAVGVIMPLTLCSCGNHEPEPTIIILDQSVSNYELASTVVHNVQQDTLFLLKAEVPVDIYFTNSLWIWFGNDRHQLSPKEGFNLTINEQEIAASIGHLGEKHYVYANVQVQPGDKIEVLISYIDSWDDEAGYGWGSFHFSNN